MEKLPETRLQFAQCDGHMFFTDTEATPRELAQDITRVTVPKQPVPRSSVAWLNHKGFAALTPVWVYLLRARILEKFDWVLHAELDHFTRPSLVRPAIAETLDILRTGTAWERSFFLPKGPTPMVGKGMPENPAAVQTKPMVLAFGNAFIFNRAVVELMKLQFPFANMAKDHGCPVWIPGHCEQDMVYPRMMSYFRPPVQMFGPTGCGKVSLSWTGKKLPMGCWEFFQNPAQLGPDFQSELGQLRALEEIAAGKKGRLPSATPDHAVTATGPRLLNVTETEWGDEDWDTVSEQAKMRWEGFFPPKNIPILHHAMTGKVLKTARLLLGL